MRALICIFIGLLAFGQVHATAPAYSTQQDILGPDLRTNCWSGNLDQVTLLLDEGAPIEGRDRLGRTPLLLACHGDPEIVKVLLAHGARVDAVAFDGDTTMSLACEYGELPSAQMLLAAGADFNQANEWGRTPLILASREGHDALVSLLISHHADVNFQGKSDPALFYAVWKDHPSTAKLLLDAGAKLTRSYEGTDLKDKRMTLMTMAALTGDLSLVDLLLFHGANINEQDAKGLTALHVVSFVSGKEEMLRHLIEKGADPNLADNNGETPFMSVAENQDIPMLRVFLQHGANLEAHNMEGRTALILAARISAAAQIRELIQDKANVNAVDSHGETALTYAGDRGNTRIVDWLKDAGAIRTDLHIIPKENTGPSLSKSQLWALAVGALYGQNGGRCHAMLSEKQFTERSRRSLEKDWGIKDRETLIRTITELERGPTFFGLMFHQVQDSLTQPGVEGKFQRGFQLLFVDLYWRGKTNVAWDLCRATNLVRMGVDAGLIRENEAWPFLLLIAHKTQNSFHSWQEMSDNFLDSREIIRDERSGDFRACARLLLNPQEPNSPWNQNPWNADLSAN